MPDKRMRTNPDKPRSRRKVYTDPELTRRGQPRQRRTYTDDEREGALELLRKEVPLADVHRQTGIPKGTLSKWRKAAGIPQQETAAVARTRSAAAATAERIQGIRLTQVERLDRIIDQAGTMIGALVESGAEHADAIAELGGDRIAVSVDPETGATRVVVDSVDAEVALKRGAALAQFPIAVRDLVGIYTRAIHDSQLLKGEATERGNVVVEFAIPRPPRPAVTDGVIVEGEVEP